MFLPAKLSSPVAALLLIAILAPAAAAFHSIHSTISACVAQEQADLDDMDRAYEVFSSHALMHPAWPEATTSRRGD